MSYARTAFALGLLACGCGERYAQTATVDAADYGAAPVCKVGIEQRLSVKSVQLGDNIRYRARAYDNIARDERLAFALGPDENPSVAWLNNAGDTVHVSSLNADGSFRAKDVTLASSEVGGLAVRPDGFLLFTSGPDPGEALFDPNHLELTDPVNRAALLSRYRNGAFEYSAPLTGTQQITPDAADRRRDCTPVPLTGRLARIGNRYGAYFAVHGCTGHAQEKFYGDKLVYLDDSGQYLAGGFSWKCSISEGLELLPEAERFTSLCMTENSTWPGLNRVLEDGMQRLAVETYNVGYVGGQFGGIVKMSDGSYVVAWLSRGTTDNPNVAAKKAPDIALMHLASDYSVITDKTWLMETPDVAENNLHIAPYGPNRVLLIWDAVEGLTLRGETTFGTYTGTRARLFDPAGVPVGNEEALPAPPNGGDDIAVYANGDLGWAFVPDSTRSYARPLDVDAQGVPQNIPLSSQLAIARLAYCR